MSENINMKAKAQRIKWVLTIMERTNKMEYIKLIAIIEMNFGASTETAKEYIQTCINAGCLGKENGNVIYITKDYGA